jgi:hypothetical protein
MRRNPCMDVVADELARAGLDYQIDHRGKHLKFKFAASGRAESYTVPASSGDRQRGFKNARAQIRRIIRRIQETQ